MNGTDSESYQVANFLISLFCIQVLFIKKLINFVTFPQHDFSDLAWSPF
jgi:hypothetical protein